MFICDGWITFKSWYRYQSATKTIPSVIKAQTVGELDWKNKYLLTECDSSQHWSEADFVLTFQMTWPLISVTTRVLPSATDSDSSRRPQETTRNSSSHARPNVPLVESHKLFFCALWWTPVPASRLDRIDPQQLVTSPSPRSPLTKACLVIAANTARYSFNIYCVYFYSWIILTDCRWWCFEPHWLDFTTCIRTEPQQLLRNSHLTSL